MELDSDFKSKSRTNENVFLKYRIIQTYLFNEHQLVYRNPSAHVLIEC